MAWASRPSFTSFGEAWSRRFWIFAYSSKYGRISWPIAHEYWNVPLRCYARDIAALRAMGVRFQPARDGVLRFGGFDPMWADAIRLKGRSA